MNRWIVVLGLVMIISGELFGDTLALRACSALPLVTTTMTQANDSVQVFTTMPLPCGSGWIGVGWTITYLIGGSIIIIVGIFQRKKTGSV
jgi:hypothetical protein